MKIIYTIFIVCLTILLAVLAGFRLIKFYNKSVRINIKITVLLVGRFILV